MSYAVRILVLLIAVLTAASASVQACQTRMAIAVSASPEQCCCAPIQMAADHSCCLPEHRPNQSPKQQEPLACFDCGSPDAPLLVESIAPPLPPAATLQPVLILLAAPVGHAYPFIPTAAPAPPQTPFALGVMLTC